MIQKSLKGISSFLHEYLTYLFFLLIPLSDSIQPLSLGIFVGAWLFWRLTHLKEKMSPLKSSAKIGLLFFFLFVVVNYCSAFWGDDPSLAGRLMEHRLSFWVLVILLFFKIPSFLNKSKLITSYFIGNLISIVWVCVRFIYEYFTDDSLMYQLDSLGLDSFIQSIKHPSYLSLNLVLSFYLYWTTIKDKRDNGILLPVVTYVMFGAFIFVGGSRAGFLNFGIMTAGMLFYYAKSRFSVKQILIISVPLVMLFCFSISQTQKFELMFDNSEHVSVRAPRQILWKTGVEMMLEKPLFGHGLGSSHDNFIARCKRNGLYIAGEKQYNVHNQYLEYALESGVLSLFLFLLSLYYFSKSNDRKKRCVTLGLLCLFCFALFFESMLLRIAAMSTFVGLIILMDSFSNDQDDGFNLNRKFQLFVLIPVVLFIVVLCLKVNSSNLNFNPLVPATYANKNFILHTHDSLPGDLPEELRIAHADAAKYDNTAVASLWSGDAHLLNQVADKALDEHEKLVFSVFCYVSTDFDGAWVKISIDNIAGGPALVQDYYDIKKKGTWQKLEVQVNDASGSMPAHFFFARHNCNSLEELEGYVLFAYPQYIITKK